MVTTLKIMKMARHMESICDLDKTRRKQTDMPCQCRSNLQKIPFQKVMKFIGGNDAAWRTSIRLDRGCADSVFIDHHVLPYIDAAAYPDMENFMPMHRKIHYRD
jgi:hypothetical protein